MTRHESRAHQILRCSCNILRLPRPIRGMHLHILPRDFVLPLPVFSILTLVLRSDLTGTYHVDSDAQLRETDSHAVHKAYQAGFGGSVAFLIWVRLLRSEGADEDDARPCFVVRGERDGVVGRGVFHEGDAGLGDGEGSGKVGFDERLPLVDGVRTVRIVSRERLTQKVLRGLLLHCFAILPICTHFFD